MLTPVSRYPNSPCAISITRLTSIQNPSHAGYLNRHPVHPRGHGGVPGSVDGKTVHRFGGVAYGDELTWDRGTRSQQHHVSFCETPLRKRDCDSAAVIIGHWLIELDEHLTSEDFGRQFLRGDQRPSVPHIHAVLTASQHNNRAAKQPNARPRCVVLTSSVGSVMHNQRLRGTSPGDRGHAHQLPTNEHVHGERAGFFCCGHPTRPTRSAHRERGLRGVGVRSQLSTCSIGTTLILRAHVPIRVSDHADEQRST